MIVVPTEQEAFSVLQKAQSGADFSELARKFSKDGTAANGGDLGYVTQQGVAPEVGGIMFALSPGQITQFPVKSVGGYFILRVEGRRQRATPTFEEARTQIEGMLRAETIRDAVESVTSHIKIQPPPGVSAPKN